jgi:ADP-glucose pyrophosphorylase
LLRLPTALRRRVLDHDPVHEMKDGVAAVGTGAQIHESARVRGHAALGFASFVSRNVIIEDSVVMPEAWIGADCSLKRTVVAPGVEVPAGFQIDDSMICLDPGPGADLPDTVRRVQGLLLCPLDPGRRPS